MLVTSALSTFRSASSTSASIGHRILLRCPNRLSPLRSHQLSRRRTTTSSTQPDPPFWKSVPSLSFFVGTAAGIAGSLAGMGGGFVMIPLMTSRRVGLCLSQHQAHGTSLFAVMATGLAGAISYGRDHVQLESAAMIALTGMVSARVGAKLTTSLSSQTLKKALGVLLLATAPAIPIKAYIVDRYAMKHDNNNNTEEEGEQQPLQEEKSHFQRLVPPLMIGVMSGFLAGVFGVGGGVVVVPGLTLATDVTHYQALATSLAAMSLPAAVGTYTHYSAGNVALRVAPALSIGALAGAYMGGKCGLKTDETTLRWGFSGLLAFLGVRTLLKA